MSDTATRVAGLPDEDLLALHKNLDTGDFTDPAITEAHHLVANEMLKRGHDHGHVDDEWSSAVVLVEKVWVSQPEEIEAPPGMEAVFEKALARGGEVSVLLTTDGYVMKAEPGSSEPEEVEEVWDYDDPEFLSLLSAEERAHFAEIAAVLDADGDPDLLLAKRGNPEPLRDYWRAGGKGKINWGAGGDFTACAAAVSKYMTSEEAKGYCAIRHREMTGMWPGDKRNRAKKAADLTSTVTFTLPGGAVYAYNGDVAKHGSPGDPGYASLHPTGGGSHATSVQQQRLGKGDKRLIQSTIGRAAIAEAYGPEYERGKAAARGTDVHGEPVRWSPRLNGSDSPVGQAVRGRDAALASLRDAPKGSIQAESYAFTAASHQGFIDGYMGTRPEFRRSHTFGETLSGLVGAGLSGAMKAAEVAKHGSPGDKGYAAKHPKSRAAGGKAPSGDKPDVIEFGGTKIKKGRDGLWEHLEPDGKGGFRLTAERQKLHAKIIADHVAGKPSQEIPVFTVLGGGGGSGKSILQKKVDGIPSEEESVKIDPDEVKGLIADHDGRSMKEPGMAGYLHEESSIIARGIQTAAFDRKTHVLLDGTGNSTSEKLLGKVQEARDNGYVVNGVYATVPTQLAWARNVRRGETNPDRGTVPSWAVAEAHSAVSDITPYIAGHFDTFRLYDMTDGLGVGPQLVAQAKQGSRIHVVDGPKFKKFRAKVGQFSAEDLDAIEIPDAYMKSGDEADLPRWFFGE